MRKTTERRIPMMESGARDPTLLMPHLRNCDDLPGPARTELSRLECLQLASVHTNAVDGYRWRL
jgi:hypothetical protein